MTEYKVCKQCGNCNKFYTYVDKHGRTKVNGTKCIKCLRENYRHRQNTIKITLVPYKLCVKCGQEKRAAEFHKNRNSEDGLRVYCKLCISQIEKADITVFKSAIRNQTYSGRVEATYEEMLSIYEADPFCQYCRKPLTMRDASMDHKVPLADGGKTTSDNIVFSCWPCNRLKWKMSTLEFRRFLREYRDRLNALELNDDDA